MNEHTVYTVAMEILCTWLVCDWHNTGVPFGSYGNLSKKSRSGVIMLSALVEGKEASQIVLLQGDHEFILIIEVLLVSLANFLRASRFCDRLY